MQDDRDNLKVPKEFTPTRSGVGRSTARHLALNLRAVFNTMHELQARPKASILRWLDVPGTGDPFAGVNPDTIQVEGLADLPTVVGDWEHRETLDDGEERREKVRDFTFYAVPRSDSVQGDHLASVLLTDKIQFEGDTYDVVSVDFQRSSGRCVVTATLTPISETS